MEQITLPVMREVAGCRSMRSLLEPAPPRGGLGWSPRLRLDEADIVQCPRVRLSV